MSEPLSPTGWLRGIHLHFEGQGNTGLFGALEISPQPRTFLPWRRCKARWDHHCQRPRDHDGGHQWRRRWPYAIRDWGWDYPWSLITGA